MPTQVSNKKKSTRNNLNTKASMASNTHPKKSKQFYQSQAQRILCENANCSVGFFFVKHGSNIEFTRKLHIIHTRCNSNPGRMVPVDSRGSGENSKLKETEKPMMSVQSIINLSENHDELDDVSNDEFHDERNDMSDDEEEQNRENRIAEKFTVNSLDVNSLNCEGSHILFYPEINVAPPDRRSRDLQSSVKRMVLSTVQIEEMKLNNNFPSIVNPALRMDIFEGQEAALKKYSQVRLSPNFMGSRSPKGANGLKINPNDLIDVHEYSVRYNMGLQQTDELIKMVVGVCKRNGADILLHKQTRSVKKAIDTFAEDDIKIENMGLILDKEIFGEYENSTASPSVPLKPIKCVAMPILRMLGSALLSTNAANFKPSFIEVKGVGHRASDRLLTNFSSGDISKRLTEDAALFPETDGFPVCHIFLGYSTDATKVQKKYSEQPLYFSILNNVGEDFKVHFAGYAPLNMPYTNKELHEILKNRGFSYSKSRSQLIRNVKIKAVQEFIYHTFESVCSFGNNYFRVQIGKGDGSKYYVVIIAVIFDYCNYGILLL